MAYQEVKRTSYGKNVGNSFKGIFTGLILVIVATILIFWNENRAIKTYKAIGRAQDACVEMPDINTVSPEFEGKTVHCTGIASTAETVEDPLFGISENALCLSCKVEYYQWVEHSETKTKEKLGGATEETTTYTYEKKWVSSPQASSNFKDPKYQNSNFVYQVIEEKDFTPEHVGFGAYQLPNFILRSIRGDEPAVVKMDQATHDEWNNAVKRQLGLSEDIEADYVFTRDNMVYLGASMDRPDVGDVRVTFTYVPNNQQISLIANVTGNTFEQYVDLKNGKKVSSVQMGVVSAEQMFENLKQGNKTLTWIVRLVILLVIIVGFRKIFGFAPTLLKVLPFLGKGVGYIVGFACTILGIVWTCVFTAIAWIAVRPVLGISLLVVAVALIVWLVRRSKQKQSTDLETAGNES